jgi:repressor LexA
MGYKDAKPLTPNELAALRHIRNRIVHGERPPSVRVLQELLGYSSPNAAAYVLDQLIRRGYLQRRKNGELQLLKAAVNDPAHARTVPVPLVGSVPCGAPLLAEENIEAMIPVSTSLARPPHRYFLLRASGDSMDLAGIHDGDLVLVRQQSAAENGQNVVALIDDEATLKVFRRKPNVVALVPRSRNKDHKPILLSNDFQVQGVVVATIPNLEKE